MIAGPVPVLGAAAAAAAGAARVPAIAAKQKPVPSGGEGKQGRLGKRVAVVGAVYLFMRKPITNSTKKCT